MSQPTDSVTPVPAQPADTTQLTVAPPASTGLSLFQRLKAEGEKRAEVIPVEKFVEHLGTKYGEAAARKYYSILKVIKPVDPGDIWRPSLMAICSQKGTDRELIKRVGPGGIYVHSTKKPVDRATLFFPLFSHIEHAWFEKEQGEWKTVCRSNDGVKGSRFGGDKKGATLTCGSADCPNTPSQFQKSIDKCKWSRALYVVDSTFTNIYQVSMKYFSVKDGYDNFIKMTKQNGQKFDPNGAQWFTLEPFEKGGDKGEGWYFRANQTDSVIKPEDVEIIEQMKLLIEYYQTKRITERDTRDVTAVGDMAELDATPVVVNEEDGSSFVSM